MNPIRALRNRCSGSSPTEQRRGAVRRLGFAPIPGRRFNSNPERTSATQSRPMEKAAAGGMSARQVGFPAGGHRTAAALPSLCAAATNSACKEVCRVTARSGSPATETASERSGKHLFGPTARRFSLANIRSGSLALVSGTTQCGDRAPPASLPFSNPGASGCEREAWSKTTQQSTGAYVVWLGSACANPRCAALRSEPVHATHARNSSNLSMRGARAGHTPMRAGRGDNAPLMKGRCTSDPARVGECVSMIEVGHGVIGDARKNIGGAK